MKACGLIVEYNPFHNGHVHHLEQAKKVAHADCLIAVMSGPFLQRGEPAIIDKFHRAKAALATGIDIVLELPFVFAVQNSDLFAKGAVQTLAQIGVTSICFGSESGDISTFLQAYKSYNENERKFNDIVKNELANGISFPEASKQAYKEIGLSTKSIDLTKPNNILGFSYVKNILKNELNIEPLTIQRTKNQFHDKIITDRIASATSIRNKLLKENESLFTVEETMPTETMNQLKEYKKNNGMWHDFEHYFSLLQYRVQTMSLEQLRGIHGVVEGIEYRLKETAKKALSFQHWVELIKTKRYTWTRIQRIFIHILTNTTKEEISPLLHNAIPYIRILGFNQTGQTYLNKVKKDISLPIISGYKKNMHPMLEIEERASYAYYSILETKTRKNIFQQELTAPIISQRKK